MVAVYGPALEVAAGMLGASGSVWTILQAMADKDERQLRDGAPWYYVWVLSRATARD